MELSENGDHVTYDDHKAKVESLEARIAEQAKEIQHWKANHDTMVTKAAFLSQRPDLPVDRIPAYQELVAVQARIAELEAAQGEPVADFVPDWAGEFRSFSEWVNKAQSWLKSPSHRPAICIDAKGRRCTIGADMMRARDENAFPVRYFWECQVYTRPAAQVVNTDERAV